MRYPAKFSPIRNGMGRMLVAAFFGLQRFGSPGRCHRARPCGREAVAATDGKATRDLIAEISVPICIAGLGGIDSPSLAVDTTVCRPVVPQPQTTASKMSDTRVCGH